MLIALKRLAESIPEPVGRHLALVPFGLRLGRQYGVAREEIRRFAGWSGPRRKEHIFRKVRAVVEHAIHHNDFYRWYYGSHGLELSSLRGFDDIQRIPIVKKSDLRAWELERRSSRASGRFRVNTGGTSGEPLEFYLTNRLFAREWAHMHEVWSRVGYRQSDLKLTFRGKKLGDRVVKYNPVHNEFVVSAYHAQPEIAATIRGLLQRRSIRYLHGYPSAISEFASYCLNSATDLLQSLRSSLRGVLLGSEYPAAVYRDRIENAFRVPTISWYGHSEMAVLAFERDEKYVYSPLHTYGFAEAVQADDGGSRLVGTSYHNLASPFIRYDTGDSVDGSAVDGVLNEFRVTDGRVGEFLTDRNGQRISLTALIFGRHHAAFGAADFVQVHQSASGKAMVIIVPRQHAPREANWRAMFDLRGVDLDFEFELAAAPYRTAAGKVPLLVRR